MMRKENFVRLTDSEAPRPQSGASRQGIIIHIVPLDPASQARLAGRVPVHISTFQSSFNINPSKKGESYEKRKG
jgi:hypothetical protein